MNIDMTQGSVARVLIKFTIPVLIGDMFQQLYNLVDTIIVGQFVGTDALAAVGATGTISFLIVGFCIALANGFAVVTSQKYGGRDEEGVKRSFSTGFLLTFLICGAMSIASVLLMSQLLTWMNTPEDIFQMSYDYITIITAGVLATGFYNLFAANLRAIGNSRVPLYFLIFSSFANIGMDLLFIIVFHWGVKGAALATIFSQILSAIGCLLYILWKEKSLRPTRSTLCPSLAIVRMQLYVGIPMALQNAITASGTIIAQSAMNTFGSDVVAATTAANKVRMLYTQPLISIGQGVAMFTGQNYGAGSLDRVKKGATTAVILSSCYSVVAAVVINLLLRPELRLFISTAEEVEYLLPWAQTLVRYCSCLFVFLGFIFVYRNGIQGCGMSTYAMLSGVVELCTRIVFARLAIIRQSFTMACLCDCLAWVAAGCFTLISFYVIVRIKKRRRMLETASF